MVKFIIILALIFYVLPKLIKWALKGFIVTQVNKVQQDMRQQQQTYPHQRREGEIDVDYNPKNKGKKPESFGGDYVDYEEVK